MFRVFDELEEVHKNVSSEILRMKTSLADPTAVADPAAAMQALTEDLTALCAASSDFQRLKRASGKTPSLATFLPACKTLLDQNKADIASLTKNLNGIVDSSVINGENNGNASVNVSRTKFSDTPPKQDSSRRLVVERVPDSVDRTLRTEKTPTLKDFGISESTMAHLTASALAATRSRQLQPSRDRGDDVFHPHADTNRSGDVSMSGVEVSGCASDDTISPPLSPQQLFTASPSASSSSASLSSPSAGAHMSSPLSVHSLPLSPMAETTTSPAGDNSEESVAAAIRVVVPQLASVDMTAFEATPKYLRSKLTLEELNGYIHALNNVVLEKHNGQSTTKKAATATATTRSSRSSSRGSRRVAPTGDAPDDNPAMEYVLSKEEVDAVIQLGSRTKLTVLLLIKLKRLVAVHDADLDATVYKGII